ncbi:MAG: flagellar type III secretion system pore protein FliP [Planctomycetes bacterium]|nr:flagellar type III secretion system pore protein FliP [Planctomycetota bacterium]
MDRLESGFESVTRADVAVRPRRTPRVRAGFASALLAATLLLGAGAAEARATDGAPAASSGAGGATPAQVFDPVQMMKNATSRESLGASLQIVVLLTVLTVAPSIVLMMTCFVRITVVLILLRQAMGTQSLPPSQLLLGLALFMTMLVMAPTWERIRENAVDPYVEGDLDQLDALAIAGAELRTFMFDQIEAAGNENDVYMLYEYAVRRPVAEDEVITREQVPMMALIPAFVLSELKAAFIIGFRIYLPFLVVDMVIATMLVSMGMMMLPPVLISLPFKLLLFVLADGWHLVAGSLMASVV